MDRNIQKARDFLSSKEIQPGETELQKLQVTDALADAYRQGTPANRFIISQTLMVRSANPMQILEASQQTAELVKAGVVVTGQQYGNTGPTFLFTKLNDLKPEMIADATARAREAAVQFANDSASQIGGIRRANQGVFVILPRDQAPGIQEQSQIHKRVRVVSTIEYFLE